MPTSGSSGWQGHRPVCRKAWWCAYNRASWGGVEVGVEVELLWKMMRKRRWKRMWKGWRRNLVES